LDIAAESRDFTVPIGTDSRSAIPEHESPSKYASSMTWRCSLGS
jgi:hypothetical protein